MTTTTPLRFKVTPHVLQDLGLNLYTSLPRVLVEFVANAYDADSPYAKITMDFDRIEKARKEVKRQWEIERTKAELARMEAGDDHPGAAGVEPLGERTLPEDVTIEIEDHGHGMSRDDLANKFLVAGRRRREEDKEGVRSPGGRIVMGRKGLGKLAGFGVARKITVISRKIGESYATKIVLDYDELIKKRSTDEIEVYDEIVPDGGGLEPSGTRIILSKLVYEPLKNREATIANQIGDHFAFIDQNEFTIYLNKEPVEPTPRELVFAYPEPDRPIDELVTGAIEAEGRELTFKYRIRFTAKSLKARDRGVRIYAHKRLAAAPDLLDLPTGMHGFRLTDYLDGVVHADFIDDQPTDYISSDRQSLRWEVPLLVPLREFLTERMKEAVVAYQKKRDQEAKEKTKQDEFTRRLIEGARLPNHKKRFAYRIAASLASITQDGTDGEEYRQQLQIFVNGLGQGTILKTLADLAKEDRPDLQRVVAEATKLTDREFGEFMTFVEGRIDGILALKKICESVNFRAGNNEAELHELFKRCPWLIDPSFTQFLISDQWLETMFARLAKYLEIGDYAPEGSKNDDRADLVFLLGNRGLERLVIVELKATNTCLVVDHLNQLESYMRRARDWLSEHHKSDCRVHGILIGSKAPPESKAEGVQALRDRIERHGGPRSDFEVLDVLEVLERTLAAHRELQEIYDRLAATEDQEEEVMEEVAAS